MIIGTKLALVVYSNY